MVPAEVTDETPRRILREVVLDAPGARCGATPGHRCRSSTTGLPLARGTVHAERMPRAQAPTRREGRGRLWAGSVCGAGLRSRGSPTRPRRRRVRRRTPPEPGLRIRAGGCSRRSRPPERFASRRTTCCPRAPMTSGRPPSRPSFAAMRRVRRSSTAPLRSTHTPSPSSRTTRRQTSTSSAHSQPSATRSRAIAAPTGRTSPSTTARCSRKHSSHSSFVQRSPATMSWIGRKPVSPVAAGHGASTRGTSLDP